MKNWTFNFFRRYYRYFTFGSVLAYRKLLINELQGRVGFETVAVLRMKWPVRQNIQMRPASNDHYTFTEVFQDEVYGPVCRHARDVKSIVDLGANIGFASLYMLNKH